MSWQKDEENNDVWVDDETDPQYDTQEVYPAGTYNDDKFNTADNLGGGTGVTGSGFDLSSLAKTLGLTDKNGAVDWSKILGLGAAGASLLGGSPKQSPAKSPSELLSMQPSNQPPGWTQAQVTAMQTPLKAGNQLERIYSADMPSTIRPGVGYAEGGEVEGPLSAVYDSSQMQGPVQGPGGGQDDQVDAALSPGEYVFDAESVSMLGDGDNAAGARKLDELRASLREHKRSAPPDEIAPRSLGPLSYLGGING